MTEKRFTLDDEENGLCRCILVDGEEMPTCEVCELLNELVTKCHSLEKENEQLKKSEKINMEYAEQIIEENHKFRIAKNSLQRENEQLQKENTFFAKQRDYWKGKYEEALETFDIDEATATKITELEKENEQLKQKLENLDLLNKENNSVELIDGKFFIRK